MHSKRIFILIFAALLLSSPVPAQNQRMLLRSNGERTLLNPEVKIEDALESAIIESPRGGRVTHNFPAIQSNAEVIDTISYFREYGFSVHGFSFDGQDVEMVWFEAPGDMIIKAAGISCSDTADNINGSTVSVQLIKLNWTKEQLMNVAVPGYMGYYPSDNDGMNNAAPFPSEATGDWIDKTGGQYSLPPWDPDDYDLWSDDGRGIEISPQPQLDEYNRPAPYSYQWVEMNSLGHEPYINSGEVFAVVVKNNGTDWTTGNDRIAVWARNDLNFPGWKYYEDGRDSLNKPGWWARKYIWDFAVIAEFIGVPPLDISDVTELTTTFMETPRDVYATVRDSNPDGGTEGIKRVSLYYSSNGSAFNQLPMVSLYDNMFTATIPAQLRGSHVRYYIEAEDLSGNTTSSENYEYQVFKNSNGSSLIIINGMETDSNYMNYYLKFLTAHINGYFDVWYNGPVEKELLMRYLTVIEITTNGPLYDNSKVIREWLEHRRAYDYLLAGDEWLTFRSGGINKTFYPGSFEYDILGVTEVFNDIADPVSASTVYPVENSELAGELYSKMISNGHSSIDYDPFYNLDKLNFLDGFNVRPENRVHFNAEDTAGNNYIIGTDRYLGSNEQDRVVFMSFDPLSLSKDDPDSLNNFWYSYDSSGVYHIFSQLYRYRPTLNPPEPVVEDVTQLSSTSSSEPRTVMARITSSWYNYFPDDNTLRYTVNGGDTISVEMRYYANDYYSAELPGMPEGTEVTYQVRSRVEVGYEGWGYNTFLSPPVTYRITPHAEGKTLVIFNGFENITGFPQNYYFMGLDESIYNSFHKIAGEPLTSEMAENYENIFEIFAKEYAFDNKDVIREWLNSSESRNYFLCGQYFVKGGRDSNDSLYAYGDFEFDLLGLTAGRTDINSIKIDIDSVTVIIPVADTELGGSIYDQVQSMQQNAVEYRLSSNAIDAVFPSLENEISFTAYGKDGEEYIVGTSRILNEGNKIAFLTYDPVMLYASPDDYWYGGSEYSPIVQAYHWFNRVPTDIEEETIVYNFRLSQNYPNPFNPSTVIEYSIPAVERLHATSLQKVTLKIYDVLGRKIATLVDRYQTPGEYRISFNATKYGLASGVYIYSLYSGAYSQTKKMVLLH